MRLATTGITYASITSPHSDIYYATQATADALQAVANDFKRNYPQRTLYITAASVIYGGLNDIDTVNSWRRPHNRHRVGEDVDLNVGSFNREVLLDLEEICERNDFTRADAELDRNHVHCYHRFPYTR